MASNQQKTNFCGWSYPSQLSHLVYYLKSFKGIKKEEKKKKQF